MAAVRFPGKPVDPAAEDVAAPLQELLRDLALLEQATPGEVSLTGGTPVSLQVIRAGALDVTKAWSALTGVAGFAGTAATLLAAWKAAPDNLQITLVGGASVILAATAIAIALIVRSDIAGRAVTTAELYRSRAQVSNVFLASLAAKGTTPTTQSVAAATLAEILSSVEIEIPGEDKSAGLRGVRKRSQAGPWEVQRGDGDWVELSPSVTFEAKRPTT